MSECNVRLKSIYIVRGGYMRQRTGQEIVRITMNSTSLHTLYRSIHYIAPYSVCDRCNYLIRVMKFNLVSILLLIVY